MLNATELLNGLGGFYGTDGYHKLTIFPGFVGTDGVKYLAQNAECFWLIDEIAIANATRASIKNNPALQDIQFWELTVKDRVGTLTCRVDSDQPPVFQKTIGSTDFPLPSQKIWVAAAGDPDGKVFKVLMLPSEY
jgi:hypothetical protein